MLTPQGLALQLKSEKYLSIRVEKAAEMFPMGSHGVSGYKDDYFFVIPCLPCIAAIKFSVVKVNILTGVCREIEQQEARATGIRYGTYNKT